MLRVPHVLAGLDKQRQKHLVAAALIGQAAFQPIQPALDKLQIRAGVAEDI